MARSAVVVDNFSEEAHRMREHFLERFGDPRSTRRDRFVWDYWHVPGQYTALRTPAWEYFPKSLYESFHRRLVDWGRRTLGCHDVSPPWLSCYVDGCRQEWHGDLPHGPWAFVFSLTDFAKRKFSGGETLLLRDEVLDHWHDFTSTRAVEEDEVLRAIAPKFNRLTVFDPRIPHAVRRVEGTHDPRAGRLVIHGWFVQPRPFVEGPLRLSALAENIDALVKMLPDLGVDRIGVSGLTSLGFDVDRSGRVRDVRVLSDTTRVVAILEPERKKTIRRIVAIVKSFEFPPAKKPSNVVLPLVFLR